MNTVKSIAAFMLDGVRYGIHLSAIEKVARAAEITPLPKAPDVIVGIVNVHGRVIPVVNIRKRFRLPHRELTLNDQFIIAHTSTGSVVMIVDAIQGIVEYGEDELVPSEQIVVGAEYLDGVVKLPDGMVLIHDLETLLSPKEQRSLDRALKRN